MGKHILEFDEKCKSCKGTGVFVGMAERDGIAVVCNTCNGTGKHHVVFEYEDFEKREDKKDVLQVVEVNPGIVLGTKSHHLNEFGGMSYDDWKAGKAFTVGMENRKYICPCWWYQSADYNKKPKWKECIWGGSFSGCKYFKTKEKCWERFDKEQKTV